LERSIIILAGGLSKRFGQDKCLIELKGKPLILHLLNKVARISDENVVVVGSLDQRKKLESLLNSRARIVVDKYEGYCPLVGALTGFESVNNEYALLLPCDAPLVSTEIATLLLEICINRSAAIPRWPNGYIEPLQAAYNTKLAINAAKKALEERKYEMSAMINFMRGVRYISTLVLQQYDPKLLSFFNVNTPQDLKQVKSMLHRVK
jgi:molybdopterin-guanine dinucleotide biosynthesis protein A